MAKVKTYVLIALSFTLNGRLFKKEDNKVFSEKDFAFADLLAAEKAGFLEEVENEVDNSDEFEFPEDMPGRKALIDAEITSYELLDGVEDLISIKGIGESTKSDILTFLEENN